MSFTVAQVSRLYCIPVIDYLDEGNGYGREGNWLLVAAGTGLMMAVMDQEKRFRWCVDIDGLRNGDVRARLADWLIAMEQLVDHIAVVGGWCVSNPAPLAAALRALNRPVVVYATTVTPENAFDGLPRTRSLSHFFWKLDQQAQGSATGEPEVEDSFH